MPDTVSLLPVLKGADDQVLFRSFAEMGGLMLRLQQKDSPFPVLHGPWKNFEGRTRSGGTVEPLRSRNGTVKW